MVRTSLNTSLRKRKFKRNAGLREDRLSHLPDDLVCRILSHLPTKDSVCSSVLSKRWREVWLHVPALDLDSKTFEDDFELLEFVDSFMESNKELEIKRFKLSYDPCEHFDDDFEWMISEVIKHKVCDLTILNYVDLDEALVRMPLSLYSCASLVGLNLYCVVMDDPESQVVSLPCVKTMSLEAVKFDGAKILDSLISNCPVLEALVVRTHDDDYLEVVCVRSQSLKSFELDSHRTESEDPVFEIDAPRLEHLSINYFQCEKLKVHSLGPSTEVNIDVVSDLENLDPLEITMIRDFIKGLSTVRKMNISSRSLEVFYDFANLESLPQFTKVSILKASLVESYWEVLATFLGCCINLQSLVLELDNYPLDIEEMEDSPLPRCFRSSLEFVALKTPTGDTEIPNKKKIADYFLRNCAILKKVMWS